MNEFFQGDRKYLLIALGLVVVFVVFMKKPKINNVATTSANPLNDTPVRTYIPTSTTNIEYAKGDINANQTTNNGTGVSTPTVPTSGEKIKAINIHSKTATYNTKGGAPTGAITHSTDGSPMTVVVVQDTGDGWVQIKTDWGLQWIQPDHLAPQDPNPAVTNLADQWDVAVTNHDTVWMDKIRAAAQKQGLNMGSIMAH